MIINQIATGGSGGGPPPVVRQELPVIYLKLKISAGVKKIKMNGCRDAFINLGIVGRAPTGFGVGIDNSLTATDIIQRFNPIEESTEFTLTPIARLDIMPITLSVAMPQGVGFILTKVT